MSLRTKLEAGQAVAGAFLGLRSPDAAELMSQSGFDFLLVDAEHSNIGPDGVLEMLRDRVTNTRRKRVYVLIGNEPFEACMERIRKVIELDGDPVEAARRFRRQPRSTTAKESPAAGSSSRAPRRANDQRPNGKTTIWMPAP